MFLFVVLLHLLIMHSQLNPRSCRIGWYILVVRSCIQVIAAMGACSEKFCNTSPDVIQPSYLHSILHPVTHYCYGIEEPDTKPQKEYSASILACMQVIKMSLTLSKIPHVHQLHWLHRQCTSEVKRLGQATAKTARLHAMPIILYNEYVSVVHVYTPIGCAAFLATVNHDSLRCETNILLYKMYALLPCCGVNYKELFAASNSLKSMHAGAVDGVNLV